MSRKIKEQSEREKLWVSIYISLNSPCSDNIKTTTLRKIVEMIDKDLEQE